MLRILASLFLAIVTTMGYANEMVSPLPADQAFVFSTYLNQTNQLVLQWDIAPGYYLYREQLNVKPALSNAVSIGKIKLPLGVIKQDMLHGSYQAYQGMVKVPVILHKSSKGLLNLNINYQGCSSAGFCYAPIKKSLAINLSKIKPPQNLTRFIQPSQSMMKSPSPPKKDAISEFLAGSSLLVLIMTFLGLGLLLAFTPCVLPMVPILSGIIVGQSKKETHKNAFLLSLSYVIGMALTYAVVGVVVALIGQSIQAELQKPWIIVLFSGIFVLLSLSLLGFYQLQLPSWWQNRVSTWNYRARGGTYLGVFAMGSLSTLIVSPCVSAPLVGVLAYIGQTGDVLLGAAALLALGVGMGIPLLLIGMSADKFLPKAGAWMLTVERAFGIIMLGTAIWMLSRMIPGPVTLFLWAVLAIFSAIFLGIFSPVPRKIQWLVKSLGFIVLIYGVILFIGALEGNTDPLSPWEEMGRSTTQKPSSFVIIHSMTELNQQLAAAKQKGQPVLLDFYADWCVSCVQMDHQVFPRSDVQGALTSYLLLRLDVTQNNAFDQAVQKHFQVIGPPTVFIFNANGQIVTRIVGEISAKELIRKL